ncbi:MAG TPA: MFS transporter [Candidatus Saccharimonadia bacterium]
MSKQQRLILVVSILASFVAFLDIAVVNVALPAIQRELGGGLAAQQWVVDAYLITLGSLILIAGSLSDLFGRKKILAAGLIGFAVASVLCAAAPTSEFLIVARALQGVAGALLVPSSLALIISSFSGPAQGKAIGTWTAWTGISFIVGPLVGGLMVDLASWRLVFAINVIPIAVTLFLMKSITLKEAVRENTKVDFLGSILCAAGLGGTVFALIEQPNYSWTHPLIYLPLAAGIFLLALFFWHERRTPHPMLPLSLFKVRNFTAGNLATLAIYAGLTVSSFLITVYVQQVGGYSALAAGMTLLPVTILLFMLSSRFGALAAKHGPRWFMTFGPIIGGLGFLLLLSVNRDLNYWTQLFPGIMLFSLGLAMTVAPLTTAVLADIDNRQAGIGSAINNAVARIAGLLAVAALGAVVATQFNTVVHHNVERSTLSQPAQEAVEKASVFDIKAAETLGSERELAEDVLYNASLSAFHVGVWVMALLLIAGGLISAVGIRNRQPEKAQAP